MPDGQWRCLYLVSEQMLPRWGCLTQQSTIDKLPTFWELSTQRHCASTSQLDRFLLETGELTLATTYINAQRGRFGWKSALRERMQEVDVIVTPTLPNTAMKVGESVNKIGTKEETVFPAAIEIERRDRALVAFTILTGARDGAIASLKLKHIDIDQGRVDQDAREVKTKFSKTFTTWFFPVGDDIRQIVVDWVPSALITAVVSSDYGRRFRSASRSSLAFARTTPFSGEAARALEFQSSRPNRSTASS
jgi:integrase